MFLQKREKKRHESLLTEEFVHAVRHLNQFLPPKHAIKYIGFDMARVSKRGIYLWSSPISANTFSYSLVSTYTL